MGNADSEMLGLAANAELMLLTNHAELIVRQLLQLQEPDGSALEIIENRKKG